MDRERHTKHLLLVSDKMLHGGDDAPALNAFNCQGTGNPLEGWIHAEAFPVSSSTWLASQWAYRWAKMDIYPFTTKLLAQDNTAIVHQLLVECGSHSDSSWENCNVVCISDTKRPVLQTKPGDSESGCASGLSHAGPHGKSSTCCQIHFLSKSHIGNYCMRFDICLLPFRDPTTHRCWVVWGRCPVFGAILTTFEGRRFAEIRFNEGEATQSTNHTNQKIFNEWHFPRIRR
ncbi:hypothetical protein I7I53_12087 [Histoplasma capsulatum var. duboisii H88]|uniref:Uncharacterized protein n=1 Tax=Ajellomyces capsulatus (strain H88) TaxID=544711 RepID=A0A8A1LUK7_AJEC8|nr:hypothetical protein I7I53_12087 [Histoplasma capsulatum var. duboisii H88]